MARDAFLPLGPAVCIGQQRLHLDQCLGEGLRIEPGAHFGPTGVADVEFPAAAGLPPEATCVSLRDRRPRRKWGAGACFLRDPHPPFILSGLFLIAPGVNEPSYRQILVTAGPVRRRRFWADGRSAWQ